MGRAARDTAEDPLSSEVETTLNEGLINVDDAVGVHEHQGGDGHRQVPVASPKTEPLKEMDDDEADMDAGEPAHRHLVPDTPLYLGAFHIFKSNVGVGIFLLPMVYNDFGYALSPIIAFPTGLIVIDCMLMLLRTKVQINRKKVQSYPEVTEFVFGSLARIVANGCIIMTQLSFCLMYLQAAGVILSQIFPFTGAYKVFVVIETIIVLPLCFLSNRLSLLAITSAIATGLVWFTVIATMVDFVKTLKECGPHDPKPYGDYTKWPLFIASNLTVLEGIAVVLPVENAAPAKDKAKVPKMISTTMLVIVCTYLIYAVTGYLAYSSYLTNTSVTVLAEDAFGKTVRAGLAINLMFTHPVQFVPAIQIIDKALGIPIEKAGLGSKKAILNRVGLNILISLLALLIGGDAISLITAFVGSTAALFLAVILPSLLALHVDYAVANPLEPRKGSAYFKAMLNVSNPETRFRRVRCFGYLILGVAVFCFGTVTCVIDAAELASSTKSTDGSSSTIPRNGTCPT